MPADKAIDTKTQFFRRYITALYINNENEKGENVGRKATCQKAGTDNLEIFFALAFSQRKKKGKRRDISTRACYLSPLSPQPFASFFFSSCNLAIVEN